MNALYCYPPEGNVVQRTNDAENECRRSAYRRDDYVEVENEVHDSYLFVVHPIICTIYV